MSPKTAQKVASMDKVPYREALGALMFLNQGTRPDIASAITSLGRFVVNPGKAHWNALTRVFKYIKGKKEYKLTYNYIRSISLHTPYTKILSSLDTMTQIGPETWIRGDPQLDTFSSYKTELFLGAARGSQRWLCQLRRRSILQLELSVKKHCGFAHSLRNLILLYQVRQQ